VAQIYKKIEIYWLTLNSITQKKYMFENTVACIYFMLIANSASSQLVIQLGIVYVKGMEN
jgi:hypothetical protein